MAKELRSRSPRAGYEAEQTPPNGEQDKIRKDVLALQALVHTQGGRFNTIDQRSAHTKDQVQKQQQLEASKQAIVSSWPDSAGPADRTQAVEQLVNRHDNLKGKYASTTTLRTKQGCSQFSIADFFNIFLQKRPETNLWSLWERRVEPRSSNSSAKPTNPSAVQ